eukprot:TRINITY_DN12712_c0_g1_i1.p1 TRINITY_DN12712_c0_g1~~TRINITY_DN12712_c0_g1_i1.p1  ORF type:complete len:178 (-),score=39.99 TRINITY_DN12712_c0_g1_i1:12-545(-)
MSSADGLRSLFGRGPFPRVKVLTNVFLFRSEGREVLLGKKLRGWMEGIHNGFGGKVEQGESVVEGAIRELREECCVQASAENLHKVGVFWQTFDDKPDEELEVHVFRTDTWSGEIGESDEMRPGWFKVEDIPLHNMWADDRIWHPIMLKGGTFLGRCHFSSSKDFNSMVWHNFEAQA